MSPASPELPSRFTNPLHPLTRQSSIAQLWRPPRHMLPESRKGFTKRTDERFYTIEERHKERRDRTFPRVARGTTGPTFRRVARGSTFRRVARGTTRPLENLIVFVRELTWTSSQHTLTFVLFHCLNIEVAISIFYRYFFFQPTFFFDQNFLEIFFFGSLGPFWGSLSP